MPRLSSTWLPENSLLLLLTPALPRIATEGPRLWNILTTQAS